MDNDFLEKEIWTHNDIELMGWHDCIVHAVSFDDDQFKLLFDIDYILKWETQDTNDTSYKFWVSPATLVFENVWDLNMSLQSSLELIIDQVIVGAKAIRPKNASHLPNQLERDWTIELNNGDISFKSIGFKLFIRNEPILIDVQSFKLTERGGVSFETKAFK